MKELHRTETPETDKVVVEQNVQKQIVFIGSQKKIKGLTMFEFNPKELTLEPAEFKESVAELSGTIHHKLVYKDGCIYVQALNKRNAYKKIAKRYKNLKLKN